MPSPRPTTIWRAAPLLAAIPALAATVLLAGAPAAQAEDAAEAREGMKTATARFLDPEGQDIGSARLTQVEAGVLIELEVSGLPEGELGFHIHEKGVCDPEDDFESAGSHFTASDDEAHGFFAVGGPHAGDMPNVFVPSDGTLRAHVLNTFVSLEEDAEGALLGGEGTALMIHEHADDYASQPTGEAGGRVACAEIVAD